MGAGVLQRARFHDFASVDAVAKMRFDASTRESDHADPVVAALR
jgi:hypothetical protein